MFRSPTSEIFDRVPPQNLDAEKNLLCSIFLDESYLDEVLEIIRPEDFYADAHQKIYSHFLKLKFDGKPIDFTLLLESLRNSGDYESVGGEAYIAEIFKKTYTASHATFYAKSIKEKSAKRDCVHAIQQLVYPAYDDSVTAVEFKSMADKLFTRYEDNFQENRTKTSQDMFIEVTEMIDNVHKVPKASWGFEMIDEKIGLLRGGEMVVIAARTSMGKSAFSMNICEHNAKRGRKVLFFSMEMPARELVIRMISGWKGLDSKNVLDGKLDSIDRSLVSAGLSEYSRLSLSICDRSSMTIDDIMRECMRYRRKFGLDLICIDYLGLIRSDDPKQRLYDRTSALSKGVKSIAREMNVPLLCLCQLNRSGDDTSRPNLRELRDSGAIEEDADRVAFVTRARIKEFPDGTKRYEGIGDKDNENAMIVFDKNRNGPLGNIRLRWNASAVRFENFDSNYFQGDLDGF